MNDYPGYGVNEFGQIANLRTNKVLKVCLMRKSPRVYLFDLKTKKMKNIKVLDLIIEGFFSDYLNQIKKINYKDGSMINLALTNLDIELNIEAKSKQIITEIVDNSLDSSFLNNKQYIDINELDLI